MLPGMKTYIVMIIGVIVNGLAALGKIPEGFIEPVNYVLGFLGLGALRAGVAKS